MEFTSYIVDECGTPIYKASEVDVAEILEDHPEWEVRCM